MIKRFHVLYVGQIEAAETAAATGEPAASGIVYETSLLHHQR